MKKTVFAGALALGMGLSGITGAALAATQPAGTAPDSGVATTAPAAEGIELAHGWHSHCVKARWWHYHSGSYIYRCSPPPSGYGY